MDIMGPKKRAPKCEALERFRIPAPMDRPVVLATLPPPAAATTNYSSCSSCYCCYYSYYSNHVYQCYYCLDSLAT